MAEIPSIPEFYSGQKIFITGGTGFMGKVLIEKLLRSCPDLHTIYLLIRPKKGKLPQDRIQDFTRQALFDTIRRDEPGAFDKLRAIAGDVKELGLGLSVEDKEMLQREVSIVFHSAASVRFDESVNDAVLMNVRGTREVVDLALGMDKLKVFLHVSTAFSNACDRGHVVERMYSPPNRWNWKTAIRLAEMEGMDSYVKCLTPKNQTLDPKSLPYLWSGSGSARIKVLAKILGPLLANTYVYAKALGEQVINDYGNRLPVVIVRPSVVICAFDAPITGWVDNLNGPYAFWCGVYTGVVRLTYGSHPLFVDYIPVDVAVKSMIVIAWHRALSNHSIDSKLPVYNCTSMLEPMSQKAFHDDMGQVARENPTSKMIWYPKCNLTGSWTYFYINLIVFHLIYGHMLDAVMKFKGMKPMFAQIYRRMYTASVQATSFVSINYTFDNTEFLRLADEIPESDREEFGYTGVRKLDAETLKTIILGGRANILHESLDTLPKARRNIVRLYWLDKVVKGASCLTLLWALTSTSTFHAVTALFF